MSAITGLEDPVYNTETWTDVIDFIDDETEEPYFLEASPPSEITLRLRDIDSQSIRLEGSLSGGEIAIVADGKAQFLFTDAQMSALMPKTYEVGVIYDGDGTGETTRQVKKGFLEIRSGL